MCFRITSLRGGGVGLVIKGSRDYIYTTYISLVRVIIMIEPPNSLAHKIVVCAFMSINPGLSQFLASCDSVILDQIERPTLVVTMPLEVSTNSIQSIRDPLWHGK